MINKELLTKQKGALEDSILLKD